MARRDCPPDALQAPGSPDRVHQRLERMGRREPPRALPALGSRISGSDPGSPPGRLATDRSTRAGAAVVLKLLPWASRAEQEQSVSGLMRIDSLLRGSVDAPLIAPGRHRIFQLARKPKHAHSAR